MRVEGLPKSALDLAAQQAKTFSYPGILYTITNLALSSWENASTYVAQAEGLPKNPHWVEMAAQDSPFGIPLQKKSFTLATHTASWCCAGGGLAKVSPGAGSPAGQDRGGG